MIPMNNPIIMLAQAMQRGNDPRALMQQMARQDPRMAQAMSMLQGKNTQQLKTMAENMARERGLNVDDVARQLGITIPSDR